MKRDTVAQNGRFTELKERYEENGTLISDDELQSFVGTEIFTEVSNFKKLTDQNVITGTDSDKYVIGEIRLKIEDYAKVNFSGMTQLTQERNKAYIAIAANQDYYRLVKDLEEGNRDSADARAIAFTKVSEK